MQRLDRHGNEIAPEPPPARPLRSGDWIATRESDGVTIYRCRPISRDFSCNCGVIATDGHECAANPAGFLLVPSLDLVVTRGDGVRIYRPRTAGGRFRCACGRDHVGLGVQCAANPRGYRLA